MQNTLKNFLVSEHLTNFKINNIFDSDFYRIYPVDDNKTIKIRISATSNNKIINREINRDKIILKIKILDKDVIESAKREIKHNTNSEYKQFIPEIIGIYKIDSNTLKSILEKLPNKYILDLSEFIRGDFLLMIYENYENLFHLNSNYLLTNRVSNIIRGSKEKNLIYFYFMFTLCYLHQNNISTSNIDIFNFGLRKNKEPKSLKIMIDGEERNVPISLLYRRGGYLEPVFVDFIIDNSKSKLFNINNFMPFGDNILYKNISDDVKYPYLPIELIKQLFGPVSSYIMKNISFMDHNETDIQKMYLLNMYDIYNYDYITNNNITDVYSFNILQSSLVMNCQKDTLNCSKEISYSTINQLSNLNINIMAPPFNNPTNFGKIPSNKINQYNKYNGMYGINIFGSKNDHRSWEKLTRRTCLGRYQYSQLKNAYTISKSILEINYDFFNELLDQQINTIMNMLTQELYTINGKFQIETFVLHFLVLTTDFSIPLMNNFDHSVFLEQSYVKMVYEFIEGIIQNGNIRNKLFVYLALSKILHLTLIRKLFMVMYVQENNSNYDVLSNFGISKNKITMDKSQNNEKLVFDVKSYCNDKGINYNLIQHRYNVVKELIVLKKDDIGTNDLEIYLFKILEENIKMVFLLYLYEDFKYGSSGRIRFDWNKIKPKDYILLPQSESILYPDMDIYEFYRKKNDYVAFLDRGIDTQRMSVLDGDGIFLESFKFGEPVLAGASGHTADILLCAGYLESSGDMTNFLNKMKLMTILCISVMFPRKDHSIFEMYRALQLFNPAFTTNIFTCPNKYNKTGSCFKWMLDDNYYRLAKNTFDGPNTFIHFKNKIEKNFDYYLSNKYYDLVKNIVQIFYRSESNRVNIGDLTKQIKNKFSNSEFQNINSEAFVIMTILRREASKLWMTDSEYVYDIENKHISIRNFINNNYTLPDIFINDDIYLYEDSIVTCTRSVYDYIKPIEDFDNTCLILQKIFRKKSQDKCIW
ncbi:hypothetical protein [Acanthamoeba polyphaga mimivirus]|uniref:Uncharacterized protein n=1 Tax=Acanthamoeba polyphaga mimivirus TaxID=212035 RepID=A0A2L2DJB0_MIMIV|nr:hypothetical protein [Acanthamoeba polyphaga mimivirus]